MICQDLDVSRAVSERRRHQRLKQGGFVLPSMLGGRKPSGDPYWASVTRALHFDGANGSTTFVDQKAGSSAWSPGGSGQISTAQSKFGGSSLATGAGNYIDSASSADFNFGTNPFTIDFWFYATGGGGTRRAICGQSNSAGQNNTISVIIELSASNRLRLICGSGVSLPVDISGTSTPALNTWHFGSVQRSALNIFTVFVNGVLETSSSAVASSLNSSSNRFAIGRPGEVTGLDWPGYIDDFRITKAARYSGSFTPPTSAFPNF